MARGIKRLLQVDTDQNKHLRSQNNGNIQPNGGTLSVLSSDHLNTMMKHLGHPQPQERIVGTVMVVQSITASNLARLDDVQLRQLVQHIVECLDDRVENVRIGAVDALLHLVSLSEQVSNLCLSCNVLETILSVFEACFKTSLADGWANHKFINFETSVKFFINCLNLVATICLSPDSVPAMKPLTARYRSIMVECLRSNHLDLLASTTQLLSILCQDYSLHSAYLSDPRLQQVICAHIEPKEEWSHDVNSLSRHCLSVTLLCILAQYFNSSMPFIIVGRWTESILLQDLADSMLHCVKMFSTIEINRSSDETDWTLAKMVQDLKNLSIDCFGFPSKYGTFEAFEFYFKFTKRWWLTKRNLFETLCILTSNDDGEEDEEEEDVEAMNIDDDGEEEEDEQQEMQQTLAMEVSSFEHFNPKMQRFFEIVGSSEFGKFLLEEFQTIQNAFPIAAGDCSNCFYVKLHRIGQSYKMSILSLVNNLTQIGYLDRFPANDVCNIWNEIVVPNSMQALATISSGEKECIEERLELVAEAMNTAREMLARPSLSVIVGKMDNWKHLQPMLMAVKENGLLTSALRIQIIKVVALIMEHLLKETQEEHGELVARVVQDLFFIKDKQATEDVVLAAEILDSIMDLFSGDEPARVKIAKRLKLGGTVRQAGLEFKRLVKAKRVQAPVITTVRDNVLNFARYLDQL